ncbi:MULTISPECIES: DNA-binding protein [Streptomyces violaceusniger group]|uniref:DNA-binding protein n=1 Tax=Streptomyces violaceusniger group TaxID=2839105 RepID=UPI0027DEE4CD|nr:MULTISPECIES: DNA-binding protein [Streptomyces violaceusniger group]
MAAGVLRTAPLAGELTSSLINRAAARYGLPAAGVLRLWTCRNSPARMDGGGMRADAEVVLNEAGRAVLAELCGVEPAVLARALPAFTVDDPKISKGREAGLAQGRWQAASAVAGEAAFACRSCTARRTGQALRAVRYVPRRQRVCGRHGRWLLDADADQPLEHLDLRGVPEVVAAQRRWTGVARRAVRAAADPGEVFALAHAVVARWWEEALHWHQEEIWPQRLHRVAGGNAGTDLKRWRIVGRDAVVFPEVVAVADALLDPAMAELVWRDSGAGRPRPLSADGAFCRRLGERVGRNWLGPLSAVDYGGPLLAWMGAVIRRRRGEGGPPGWRDDPWRLRREQQPATMAGGLRVMTAEAHSGGSATRWRAAVSAEHRLHITQLVKEAGEQLVELRGVHSGTTAEVARTLLEHLSESAALIEKALVHTATAAVTAGVALEEVAGWARLSAHELAEIVAVGKDHG